MTMKFKKWVITNDQKVHQRIRKQGKVKCENNFQIRDIKLLKASIYIIQTSKYDLEKKNS